MASLKVLCGDIRLWRASEGSEDCRRGERNIGCRAVTLQRWTPRSWFGGFYISSSSQCSDATGSVGRKILCTMQVSVGCLMVGGCTSLSCLKLACNSFRKRCSKLCLDVQLPITRSSYRPLRGYRRVISFCTSC